MTRTPKLALNAVLLRDGVDLDDFLGDGVRPTLTFYEWREGELGQIDDVADLEASVPGDVIVALMRGMTGTPAWQLFIEEACGIDNFKLEPHPTRGAIIFCAVTEPINTERIRWIAFTFGTASLAYRKERVEPRFGLLAALNRIVERATESGNAIGLREIQFSSHGAYRYRTDQRASRDVPLDAFRINRIADLLHGVGGVGGDEHDQMFGARPLRSREAVTAVEDLVSLAELSITDWRRELYRQDFAFIDDYVIVEDLVTITTVRELVASDLRANADTVDVFIPDDLVPYEADQAISFIALPGEVAERATNVTLTVDMIRHLVDRHGARALEQTLRFLSSSHVEIARATVLECMAAETEYGDHKFVLGDGVIYRIDRSFLARIDAALEEVEPSSVAFPAYEGTGEPQWNRAAANSPHLVLLDAHMVRLPGQAPFEAADLVHRSGALIHVKRKGRSAAMGYLFSQARLSTQLLTQFEDVRLQVEELVRAQADDESLAREVVQSLGALRSPPAGLEVVLAILGDWQGRVLSSLPLRAKIDLVQTVEHIRQLGFRPTVALVPLSFRV